MAAKCEVYKVVEVLENCDKFISEYKFRKSAELDKEYLELVPANKNRVFEIRREYEDADSFPEWSWYWTQTEEEEVGIQKDNLVVLKKQLGIL